MCLEKSMFILLQFGANILRSLRSSSRNSWFLTAAAAAFLAPGAFADVPITLTSAGAGNIMAGVYTSPYTGTVGGETGVSIICDDFADDTYVGESWTATVSTVANLAANVKWAGNPNKQDAYDQAAWLVEQLLMPANSNPTTMGYISFAIWDVLDPTDVENYLAPGSAALINAKKWEALAAAQNLSPSDFSNVLVYTVSGPATNCNGGPCKAPQEFLRVTAAEGPTPVILAADLLGLLGLIAFGRKRKLQPVS